MSVFPSGRNETLSLSLAHFPPDSFFRLFARLNHLDWISHFLFQPGMLFNDARLWWGDNKQRPHPHEGVDIRLLRDTTGQEKNVLPQMLIPTMFAGQVVHFHRDFLGKTVYIRHPEIRRGNAVLHTIHGHIIPLLDAGLVNQGDILGMISAPPATSSVPAHLHTSCAWIGEDQLVEELDWNIMAGCPSVQFVDPLPYLMGKQAGKRQTF